MSIPETSPVFQSNPPSTPTPVSATPLERTSHLPVPPDLMNQPHLVSLHGEELCTEAHDASHASAQAAIDVLALDAKVRWVIEVVVEQLKLAASVAKSIEEKRTYLSKQLYEWDTTRSKRTDALDEILEALGAQVVPPDFHESSVDSSLFGSQHPFDVEKDDIGASTSYGSSRPSTSPESPSATLRRNGSIRKNGDNTSASMVIGKGSKSRKEDRKPWKTLRYRDALDMIENDRANLDVHNRKKNDDYPETLTRTIQSIQASLPFPEPDDPGALSTTKRSSQHKKGDHYDNMANTLKEMDDGEVFGEEDWRIMNRDTEELPVILAELEESAHAIRGYHDQLATTKDNLEKDLNHLHSVLDDLDELGEIMGEMLATQESVETQAMAELDALHLHLTTLEQLHEQYVAYRMAFNKLLLEIARRRRMARQLVSMTEEESRVRDHFNVEYGQYLPEDLCLCIGNSPTTWEVVPSQGTELEVLPEIDNDLIVEAKDRIGYVDGPPGTESY
ncbi:autophagy protein Apg17-domain-containing protein [Pholiota molesta]|nr:autophagy protein Apg17-domain-containing protein [Pholiota molesta]